MLGYIYIGVTAVADDMAYLASTAEVLQLMLGVGHRYSQQHHYKIHPTKTMIVEPNLGKKEADYVWPLGDTQIHSSEETTHLGLK